MNLLADQGPFALFMAFAIGHALCDFPLQGEWLARQKVRSTASSRAEWGIALAAHSLIHSGMVWFVTGSLLLGMIELFLHGLIDFLKGEKMFGILTDQFLHILCKLGYVVFLMCV